MGIVFGAAAYALSGVAAAIDKYLLGERIPSASAYAFFVGILGLAALALTPFGFTVIPADDLALALLSGVIFIGALLAFYEALRKSDSSRVVPTVGALIPVFVILFTWIGYGVVPSSPQIGAIALFVAGGLFLAPRRERAFQIPAFILAAAAGGLLAFSFLLLIEVFKSSPFLSAFIWSRLGGALAAVGLLAFSNVRDAVVAITRTAPHSSYAIFFLNKGIGASSFFLLNYALALGPGSVVAALKGVEYLAVFLIAVAATHAAPWFIRERFDVRSLIAKGAGILMLALGFIVLTLT
ncbi:MAG: EamA family transporter [Candidatus Niyogibacteria bacterium]|nr:EamA family transporter [Candidatus Niyogibacteria bacterium]